eukprot:6172150-Prorocentrum_lima.AAC.1
MSMMEVIRLNHPAVAPVVCCSRGCPRYHQTSERSPCRCGHRTTTVASHRRNSTGKIQRPATPWTSKTVHQRGPRC